MAEKLILGKNAVYSMDCKETGINNNVIVTAASGGGKTVSIIEPRLLETTESSLVVAVSKRSLVDRYIPLFKKRGYNVLDYNLAEPEKSNICFDPLQFITSVEDIAYISNAIVMADARKERSHADPYWDQNAISLINSMIYLSLLQNDKHTFDDVLRFTDNLYITTGSGSTIETAYDEVFEFIRKSDPHNFAIQNWNAFHSLDSTKTAGCIVSTLMTSLSAMFSESLRKQIASKDCIDIESLGREKMVLFITTSAMNPALYSFANIFYSQLFKTLFEMAMNRREGCLGQHVSFLFDDFACGGMVYGFQNYISIMRAANMDCTILLQSESQLVSMYGEDDAQTIINNFDNYVYLGSNDYDTAKKVALKANRAVDDVMWMDVGKSIVFRRGQKPVMTSRYDTFEDQRYKAEFSVKLRRRRSDRDSNYRFVKINRHDKFVNKLKEPFLDFEDDADDEKDAIQDELERRFNKLFG